MALAGFAEHVLHLSRCNPDMLYIHQDSGLVNVSYYKFDVDDQTGELDSNRPVSFRLTPNITEFITSVGVSGMYTFIVTTVLIVKLYSKFFLPHPLYTNCKFMIQVP